MGCQVVEHCLERQSMFAASSVAMCSDRIPAAIDQESFDLVLTDPPYYDAIPYSDLMDFFYVWLDAGLHGLHPRDCSAFREPLAPKWDHETERRRTDR